jgi:hypothetical protein
LSAVKETPNFDPFATAFRLRARNCSAVPPGSLVVGVFQPAMRAASSSVSPGCPRFMYPTRADDAPSVLVAVSQPNSAPMDGDEPESLPDVWGADARSAQIRRPHCIAHSFQVKRYSVEPLSAKRARNLLSKDD